MNKEKLIQNIQRTLPTAQLVETPLQLCPQIQLYLIGPDNMRQPFSGDQIRTILANTPYWVFCWAGGQALAHHLLNNRELCSGKRVLDFGAGSGVVAIAATMAGAGQVVACDIDPDALDAVNANAALNNVAVETCSHPGEISDRFDLIIAADVLYDRENFCFLEKLLHYAPEVLIADSRVRKIDISPYQKIAEVTTTTLPDLNEHEEFNRVGIYRAYNNQAI